MNYYFTTRYARKTYSTGYLVIWFPTKLNLIQLQVFNATSSGIDLLKTCENGQTIFHEPSYLKLIEI